MIKSALIVGTGFEQLSCIQVVDEKKVKTPYGDSIVLEAHIYKHQIYILPRHGLTHSIAPHKINYRANIWSLDYLGVKDIIALAVVGGINHVFKPTVLIVPDQIIDYTDGREHTFFDAGGVTNHIEFSDPYDEHLRQKIIQACQQNKITCVTSGVYGTTQGPRLETRAEIKRMQQDGCDIVGMTGMPEASLAREKNLNYATIAIPVNWAAGISQVMLPLNEILENVEEGLNRVEKTLSVLLNNINKKN